MKLLINSAQVLRDAVTFTGDLDFNRLTPALRSAQDTLARYVGPVLLTELTGETLTTQQTALLPYVLAPIANLALHQFAQTGNVFISDLGLLRTRTDSTGDAFEWQVSQMLSALQNAAYDGLESLLRYLAEHVTDFPAYANSEPYQQEKARLIPSASVFSSYYEIGSSRLVFQTLLATMRTVETRQIRPLLGTALTPLLGSDLSEQQILKRDAARRALVYATMARALRERLVTVTDQGVQVRGLTQLRYSHAPSDKQLDRSILYFDGEAATLLGELKDIITPPAPSGPTGPRVRGSAIVSF